MTAIKLKAEGINEDGIREVAKFLAENLKADEVRSMCVKFLPDIQYHDMNASLVVAGHWTKDQENAALFLSDNALLFRTVKEGT